MRFLLCSALVLLVGMGSVWGQNVEFDLGASVAESYTLEQNFGQESSDVCVRDEQPGTLWHRVLTQVSPFMLLSFETPRTTNIVNLEGAVDLHNYYSAAMEGQETITGPMATDAEGEDLVPGYMLGGGWTGRFVVGDGLSLNVSDTAQYRKMLPNEVLFGGSSAQAAPGTVGSLRTRSLDLRAAQMALLSNQGGVGLDYRATQRFDYAMVAMVRSDFQMNTPPPPDPAEGGDPLDAENPTDLHDTRLTNTFNWHIGSRHDLGFEVRNGVQIYDTHCALPGVDCYEPPTVMLAEGDVSWAFRATPFFNLGLRGGGGAILNIDPDSSPVDDEGQAIQDPAAWTVVGEVDLGWTFVLSPPWDFFLNMRFQAFTGANFEGTSQNYEGTLVLGWEPQERVQVRIEGRALYTDFTQDTAMDNRGDLHEIADLLGATASLRVDYRFSNWGRMEFAYAYYREWHLDCTPLEINPAFDIHLFTLGFTMRYSTDTSRLPQDVGNRRSLIDNRVFDESQDQFPQQRQEAPEGNLDRWEREDRLDRELDRPGQGLGGDEPLEDE